MKDFDKVFMKETRSLMTFSSKDEYVEAMVEDLSDWFNYLYHLEGDDELNIVNFFENLKDGVILCKHAHVIQTLADNYITAPDYKGRQLPMKIGNQTLKVPLLSPVYAVVDFSKKVSVFLMRDNVSNFIAWCRNLNIPPSLTFETDDLVMSKNPRNVVVSLLELSRVGRLFGMEVPDIIQLEQDIEDELNETVIESKGNNNDDTISNIAIEVDEFDSSDVGNCVDSSETNTSIRENNSFQSLGSNISFGPKDRRSSAYISRHDIAPLFDKSNHSGTSEVLTDGKGDSATNIVQLNTMRKTQSVNLIEDSPDTLNMDNSDAESNFSQCSNSKFVLPKHKTPKPVGRVKIYDHFDKTRYVKAKKTREKVDLRSLDDRVREILSECSCDELFPMKRISEGRYEWGDKKNMIFVRILRTHVMVRVGGGWDTLSSFLNKHDTCRKGKCENFKFCLPALNKSSPSTTIPLPTSFPLKPNVSCPTSLYNFEQGMMVISSGHRKPSLCNDEQNRLAKEEPNKTILNNNIETQSPATVDQILVNPVKSKSATKVIHRKIAVADRNKCLSMELKHSPNTLRKKLEEMIKKTPEEHTTHAIKVPGAIGTKIPTFKYQKEQKNGD